MTNLMLADLLALIPALGLAQDKSLQTLGGAIAIQPERMMRVRMLADGTLESLGDWVEYTQQSDDDVHIATHSSLNLFDAFENDGTECDKIGRPYGGRACGLPEEDTRWFYGREYCNMFTIAEADAESTHSSDRIEFAYYWQCRGVEQEDCYVAIFMGEHFDASCGAENVIGNGIVFGFGELECSPDGYYYLDYSYIFDPYYVYTDGAVMGILARGFDGEHLELASCAQFMMWGENAGTHDLAGEHGPLSYDDINPPDGEHTPFVECYENLGVCPDPLHMMVGFGDCNPNTCDKHDCNGNERIRATTRMTGCGCKVKAKLRLGTPGAMYAIRFPSNECISGVADERGRLVISECPSISGHVSVPSCQIATRAECP